MTGQMPGDAITDAAIDAFTVACAKASSVPGATAGDCYRAGLTAALPALTDAITAQAATTEREACARLLDRNSAFLRRQGRVERAETLERHADMIRARGDLLGGTADGARTPGGAT